MSQIAFPVGYGPSTDVAGPFTATPISHCPLLDPNNANKRQDERCVSMAIAFTPQYNWRVNLANQTVGAQPPLNNIAGLFADASGCANNVIIFFPGSGYKITVLANTFGYFPVTSAKGDLSFYVISTKKAASSDVLNLFLYNSTIAAYQATQSTINVTGTVSVTPTPAISVTTITYPGFISRLVWTRTAENYLDSLFAVFNLANSGFVPGRGYMYFFTSPDNVNWNPLCAFGCFITDNNNGASGWAGSLPVISGVSIPLTVALGAPVAVNYIGMSFISGSVSFIPTSYNLLFT